MKIPQLPPGEQESVTIPLDLGKAKKIWKWLRGKREPVVEAVPAPIVPEDMDLSPADLELLKQLDGPKGGREKCSDYRPRRK